MLRADDGHVKAKHPSVLDEFEKSGDLFDRLPPQPSNQQHDRDDDQYGQYDPADRRQRQGIQRDFDGHHGRIAWFRRHRAEHTGRHRETDALPHQSFGQSGASGATIDT